MQQFYKMGLPLQIKYHIELVEILGSSPITAHYTYTKVNSKLSLLFFVLVVYYVLKSLLLEVKAFVSTNIIEQKY